MATPQYLASAFVTVALLVGTCVATAQTFADIKAKAGESAYLQDSRGVIARSGTGLCWRAGHWTPADAVPGCDGELVPPVAKPTAPAIAPVAQPSATPPAPQAAVPKRCDFSVTLINDQTFGFDKAILNTAAKKRIDEEVITKLANCKTVDIILVTGHADRLGSQQYNQKLSEKRADAVAAFIKSKEPGAQVDTLGAGKTQAVASCSDKLPRRELVTCLSPNRRVVVEVRGRAS